MNVRARELWTGDLLVTRGKIVTKLQPIAEGGLIRVTCADIVVVPDPTGKAPLEIRNEVESVFTANEGVSVVRGQPLANGMHMTQFDIAGVCHGHAHPALAQKLRAAGKMMPDA